uniref:Uncharacterized protein n=1 Tax=Anas platyrhynchos TaxID=8839 RepID=A0A8B9STU3_ANAPL
NVNVGEIQTVLGSGCVSHTAASCQEHGSRCASPHLLYISTAEMRKAPTLQLFFVCVASLGFSLTPLGVLPCLEVCKERHKAAAGPEPAAC